MSMQVNVDASKRPSNSAEIIKHFENEILNLSLSDLKMAHKKLDFLCSEFDPYQDQELSVEVENILNQYQLNEFTTNPFEYTNIVLRMLDIVANQLKAHLQ